MSQNDPIITLWENASQFFDKVANKYQSEVTCKSGCSKCCYTDISIFEVESKQIEHWFAALDSSSKEVLKENWKSHSIKEACVFLHEDKCSIYPVRPIICRTQGLPLHIVQDDLLDFCDLNFKNQKPSKEDWLNLDRLNTLLTLAAKSAKLDQRMSLKKLRKKLLEVF